jgi:hypothetical protein
VTRNCCRCCGLASTRHCSRQAEVALVCQGDRERVGIWRGVQLPSAATSSACSCVAMKATSTRARRSTLHPGPENARASYV